METRVCPKCEKAFFSHEKSGLVRCSYCAFVLLDRRDNGRVYIDMDFSITLDKKNIRAKLKDYSRGGLRAVYIGDMLDVDREINVELAPLHIHRYAKTVWSKQISESRHESGFQLLEPAVKYKHRE